MFNNRNPEHVYQAAKIYDESLDSEKHKLFEEVPLKKVSFFTRVNTFDIDKIRISGAKKKYVRFDDENFLDKYEEKNSTCCGCIPWFKK
jgi:hypothetical protein